MTSSTSRRIRTPGIRLPGLGRIRRSEAGEGVISAAIAVLIMAFLGVAMWIAFSHTLGNATTNVDHNVSQLGSTTQTGGSTSGIGGS
jgi:TM2 domain-containing membrane protein YozV